MKKTIRNLLGKLSLEWMSFSRIVGFLKVPTFCSHYIWRKQTRTTNVISWVMTNKQLFYLLSITMVAFLNRVGSTLNIWIFQLILLWECMQMQRKYGWNTKKIQINISNILIIFTYYETYWLILFLLNKNTEIWKLTFQLIFGN